jgi:hypothetical protein
MFVFVLAWAMVAWIMRRWMDVDVGWKSPIGGWIVTLGVLGSALIAVVSSVRWVASWRDYRPLVHADIESGRVIEEHYQFDEAKRFQEPEHGGLIYFLRTDDGNVLTFFDHESQDLGARGEDPLQSSFVPLAELIIVRAPRSAFVIDKRFAGKPLGVGAPLPLTVEPGEWPESDVSCDIPWNELEARLSSKPDA